MKHELKTYPQFFNTVVSGKKKFEYRRTDREFSIGDILLLKEWTKSPPGFTGASCYCRVTYILGHEDFSIVANGYVLLSIELIV